MMTISQKLKWLRDNDDSPEKTKCADKLAVRDHIKKTLGLKDDSMFVKILGVYDRADDIDFDALPDRFVLKCNHGSSFNIVCDDKKSFDREKAKEQIGKWLASDYGKVHGETFYSRIKPKVFVEENIADGPGGITDYKIMCFNGVPKFLTVYGNLSVPGYEITWYDADGNLVPYSREDHPSSMKPLDLDRGLLKRMMSYAKTLSAGFKFVRIDFLEAKGKMYFGEMTFIPGGGYVKFENPKHDIEVGSFLQL